MAVSANQGNDDPVCRVGRVSHISRGQVDPNPKAAQERLERMRPERRFQSLKDLQAFFDMYAASEEQGAEPHWQQHKEPNERSRRHERPKT